VVWVRHSDEELGRGSDAWQIVAELAPGDAESIVEKNYGDSFEDTTLEAVLSGLGVGRVVVVGAQTDACIRSTLHGALVRGYDATLVSDAHTTEDHAAWRAPPPDLVVARTNLYWKYQTAPGGWRGRPRPTMSTSTADPEPEPCYAFARSRRFRARCVRIASSMGSATTFPARNLFADRREERSWNTTPSRAASSRC